MKKIIFTLSSKITAGTFLRCFAVLFVAVFSVAHIQAQCNPDITPPTCVPPADMTISCEFFDPTLWANGVPAVTDNCGLDSTRLYHGSYGVTHLANYALFDTNCTRGTIVRQFVAYDKSGNTSACSQNVVVNYEQGYYVHFPNDQYIAGSYNWPLQVYGQPYFFGEDCELMGTSFIDAISFQGSVTRVDRTWQVINWCTYDTALAVIDVPNPNPNAIFNHVANFPGPIVSSGATGVPTPWLPTISKINSTDPSATNFSTFYDPNANGYRYVQVLYLEDTIFSGVQGNVYLDGDENCTYGTGETLLANWKVKAIGLTTGQVWNTITDANGHYRFFISELEDSVTVQLDLPINYTTSCPANYLVEILPDSLSVQNISVELEDTCQLLSVDLAAPFIRRCLNNEYTVQACNLGSTAVDSVYLEVTLDPYMIYQTSTLPATALGNNQYSFYLGVLDPAECKVIRINFQMSCEAPLGATHCSEVQIYPNVPCENYENWNGAVVKAQGYCDGDSVRMELKNVGTANMSETLDFIVVEDIIMMYNTSGSFNLDIGETKTVAFPANGATWRLEAEQEAGYPWGKLSVATVEGCGGINIPGLVTMFPISSESPYEATDCQENIGSYDPNDKQAIPKGFGESHFLRPNMDIDYLIRFQNTGTDTAFTVVVLDTLSALLDVASVRPGVGSHPYSFAVLDGGVLQFRFDHILLPDSNVNEVASHGFIKFSISQQLDNAIGSVINNDAAIYFDFNDPVITNEVTHTIGENFIEVVTSQTNGAASSPLKIYPNPATDMVTFEIPGNMPSGVFELSNAPGKVVVSETFDGQRYKLERKNLPSGLYFYRVTCTNGVYYTGKIVVR